MRLSNHKRWLLPGALVAGGVTVGSFLAPVGLASAQTDDSDDSSTETPESDEAVTPGERRGRGMAHRGGKGLFGPAKETVTEVLGLSADELREALGDDTSLADVAAAQGVPVEDLVAALVAAGQERIDDAVASGKIDDERAAEASAGLAERVEELVNSTRAERVEERGERRSERQERRGERREATSEALQEVLGLSGEEIREALSGGATVADLAEQQGVSVDEVSAALVAEATERLDAAVEEGKVDADRAAEMLESLEERVDDLIENGRPERGERGDRAERRGRAGGRHGHGPRGGDAPADGDIENTTLDA
jgi:uncharacterized protein YidB (DUF937 family)